MEKIELVECICIMLREAMETIFSVEDCIKNPFLDVTVGTIANLGNGAEAPVVEMT